VIDDPNSKTIPDNVAQAASLGQIARRSVLQISCLRRTELDSEMNVISPQT
jgi:hypothetical protein